VEQVVPTRICTGPKTTWVTEHPRKNSQKSKRSRQQIKSKYLKKSFLITQRNIRAAIIKELKVLDIWVTSIRLGKS